MKKFTLFLTIILMFTFAFPVFSSAEETVNGGYITMNEKDDARLIAAGETLSRYMKQITGKEYPVNENGDGMKFTLGYSSDIPDNGYVIETKENEDGELETLDFDSLDREEQLNVLKELTKPDLTEHETDVINYLRRNRVSFNEVIDHFVQEGINRFLEENPDKAPVQTYEIDDYTDEELYLADLKTKYPNFSDEELISKLDVAKLNEELFKKEAEVLRSQYKAEEDAAKEYEKQQEAQRYEDLQQNLIGAAMQFNTISLDYTDPESEVFEIENSDKNQMLGYLLNQDAEGKSQFVRDIEDPAKLIRIAYFMQYGDELLSNTARYYKSIIAEDRKKISKLERQIVKQDKPKDNNSVVISSKKDNNSSPTGYPKR